MTLNVLLQSGRSRFGYVRYYSTTGPDGTVFTNSCSTTMRQVIARKYGLPVKSVQFQINDQRVAGHK